MRWYSKKSFKEVVGLLENIIGVEEASAILGLSPGTIKNMCAAGKLASKKIGKTWVLDKTNLEVIKMGKWETELVTVKEVDFDHDLHAFEVYKKSGELLGTINPASIEDMQAIINDLNSGACPVVDAWEDGNGNTCTLEGWDQK
jgi:hypothetical protein